MHHIYKVNKVYKNNQQTSLTSFKPHQSIWKSSCHLAHPCGAISQGFEIKFIISSACAMKPETRRESQQSCCHVTPCAG